MKTPKSDNKAKVAYLEKNYGKNILPLSMAENDRFPGGGPIEILFFYKKDTPILKLKESILKTIQHYNLFSSRLIMIDDNKFALQYCTDGFVPTILPPMNASLDDINIEDMKKMMVHVKTLPGEPLFAVTGIPLKDGILAGISCSHAIADGVSLLLFLFAWMCITEGKGFLPPSKQRLFQGSPVPSGKIDKTFISSLSELSDQIQNRVKSNSVKLYYKKEYFLDEFLDEIKNKAKLENAKYTISNHQIMTALLLKKYHDYMLPDTDRIILRNPINLREIHPDIDSLYIGNAVFNGIAEFTKDEINQMSIPQLAYRIKKSIIGAKNENYAKEISSLSKYGVELKIEMIKNRPPSDMNRDIVSSNLTHLNDLESMFLGANTGSIIYIDMAVQTGFTILKENSGRIFSLVTSRYPLM